MDYNREHGVEVRIVRIFNTYGPRMALDDGRVVSNFVAQALTNKPITVYGDGSQTRSFQVCLVVEHCACVAQWTGYVIGCKISSWRLPWCFNRQMCSYFLALAIYPVTPPLAWSST